MIRRYERWMAVRASVGLMIASAIGAATTRGPGGWHRSFVLSAVFFALASACLVVWAILGSIHHGSSEAVPPGQEEVQKQILAVLLDLRDASVAVLESRTGTEYAALKSALDQLTREGKVEVVGEGHFRASAAEMLGCGQAIPPAIHQGPRQVEFITESNSPQRFYNTVDVPGAIRFVKPIRGDVIELRNLPREIEFPNGKLLIKRVSQTGLLVEELLPAGVTVRFEVYPG